MSYIGTKPTLGNFVKLDNLTSQFNGVLTTFNITSGGEQVFLKSVNTVIISLNGVIQEPGVDFTSGSSANSLVFTGAPPSGSTFFGIVIGDSINVGVTSDGTITESKLAGGAVTTDKLRQSAVTVDKIQNIAAYSLLVRNSNSTGAVSAFGVSTNSVLGRKAAGVVNIPLGELQSNVQALGNTIGAVTINMNNGRTATANITGNTVISFTNPFSTGIEDILDVILTNGGNYTIEWPATVKWSGGVAPALTVGGKDHLIFSTIDAGANWTGFLIGVDIR